MTRVSGPGPGVVPPEGPRSPEAADLPLAAATVAPEVAGSIGSLVTRFDHWVDDVFESRLRDNPVADRVFYTASSLGDHGIIWLILAVTRGLRSHNHVRATIRASTAVGIESVLVNGPVKWLFRRDRPLPVDQSPHPLRRPRTSSFPSGHATSAFCAAALLSEGDRAWRPVYYSLAMVVAWSRVHVRVHHASDVVGGMAIGIALGQVVKRVSPLPRPAH